jgi:membrane-bound ClpP family serine protease
MIPIVFLLIGLLLIYIEFYLPGGIIAIIGGTFILFSLVAFVAESNSPFYVILYLLFTVACIWGVIKLALWRIVHAKPDYSIYSNQDQTGYQASEYDHNAIGKQGVVTTDLKPGGYIVIEGKTHAAISLSGYLSKGTHVSVVSGEGESLYVQKLMKKE